MNRKYVWGFLIIILAAVALGTSQQDAIGGKQFEELKIKAEKGDVQAQSELARQYVKKEDFAEAVKWYQKAADQGDAQSQFQVGISYDFGLGVSKNQDRAMYWYLKAANQGNAEAQFGLARMLGRTDLGIGFLRKAAEQGYDLAQYFLGCALIDKEGVPQDHAEGIQWIIKAAQQGEKMSQAIIAGRYFLGQGVPQDFMMAYSWSILAAAQGVKAAEEMRDLILSDLTPEQIAQGQQMAREFKPRKTNKSGKVFSGNDPIESNPTASGTGFFITEDGFLITNEHVVREATRVHLLTNLGIISAKVVKVDAANDLALLQAEGKFAALPVATSRSAKLGNTVATVGFPNIGLQGFAPKLAKGEIASLAGAQDDPRYFQISVPIQPGNSGGALVDERGNVVGVVAAKLNANAALETSGALPENVNYAVKSSFLLGFLESVPAIFIKLKAPNIIERKFEDVVRSAEKAAVLVLVYK